MIIGGYILQPRKIDESDVFKMPPVTRELWLYLLRKVNHSDNGKFKRGQGFFNLETVQKDLEWYVGYRVERYSKPQLTKSLRRLREGNMIATAKATRGVFVTITNYDTYQDPKNYEGNNEETTKEERRKSRGRAIKQECKNDKNEKNKEYDLFEIFWEEYHSKTGKIKTDKEPSRKYWDKLKNGDRQKAIDKIPDYIKSVSDLKYCKKARTYLNDKNYNDEYDKHKGSTPRGEGVGWGPEFSYENNQYGGGRISKQSEEVLK